MYLEHFLLFISLACLAATVVALLVLQVFGLIPIAQVIDKNNL